MARPSKKPGRRSTTARSARDSVATPATSPLAPPLPASHAPATDPLPAPVPPEPKSLSPAPPPPDTCPVVGIGASAGGVEAVTKFLDHFPADTGAAVVILLHSDPSRKSYAVELYSRHTPMPVAQAVDGTALQANHVYVAPAGHSLTIDSQTRCSIGNSDIRGHTIDHFLVSLAGQKRENAVGIILSGSGSDGTLGIKAIKEHGGLAMAQSEGSAQHFEMPLSAIESGLVDVVLPVEDLARRLVEFLRLEVPPAGKRIDQRQGAAPIAKVLELLHARTGDDFAFYKPGTVSRRIARRAQLLNLPTLDAYLAHIREHGEELDRLHGDLLIGVTRFFRDAAAFESLRTRAIGPILEADAGHPLKVWIAGCSTGEEAYSVAILIAEELRRRNSSRAVQIFATDLDPAHLAVARAGIYPATIENDVSRDRLNRFFHRRAGGYQVAKSIREMLIFSVHNLLRDPPFSKLDLICCRNVLIYFRIELQRQLLPHFHYALRDGGFLFLGPSESVSGMAELFPAVEPKVRIYQRKAGSTARAPLFSVSRPSRMGIAPQTPSMPAALARRTTADRAERILLDYYAPAAVVVDEHSAVVRFLGRTGNYLEPAPGSPEMNLLAMARRGLRTPLRDALTESIRSGTTITTRGVRLESSGTSLEIDLTVRTLGESPSGARLWLVVFQEVGAPRPALPPESQKRESSESPAVQLLEAELRHARDELRESVEDLELSNEELRSANEEYLSVNEELQSTVEELETSKEEVQSVNEELTTVNSDLTSKVDELAVANSDIRHLLDSTQIPTLFLDADLRIRTFTTSATAIFTLLPADIGRPITDIRLKLDYKGLADDAREVLASQTPVHRRATSPDGTTYDVRVLAYVAPPDKPSGVVVTFVDVTAHARSIEDASRLAGVFKASNDAIIVSDLDAKILFWNPAAERLFGYTEAQARTMDVNNLVPEPRRAHVKELRDRLSRAEPIEPFESQCVTRDKRTLDVLVSVTPILDQAGNPRSIAAAVRDITARKNAERLLRESSERLRTLFEQAADGIFVADVQGRYLDVNQAGCELLGYSREEILGMSFHDIVVSEERTRVPDAIQMQMDGARQITEWRFRRKDGSSFPAEVSGRLMSSQQLLGIVRDISIRKRAQEGLKEAYERMGLQYEERGTQLAEAIETINLELANRARVEQILRASEARLSSVVRTAAEGIITISRRGIIDSFNAAAERLFGYTAREVIGKNVSILMPPPDKECHDKYLANYAATAQKKIIGIGREVVGARKDGSTFPMDLAIGEGADSDGPFFTGIVRDLTSRKESELRLRTAERLAAIGTLAAGLGHDMNNVLLPVRARLNALTAAPLQSKLPKNASTDLAAISESVAYLQQLADGLHFLAMDPDHVDTTQQHTNLSDWWSHVGLLLSKGTPRHVKMTGSIPADLPDVAVAAAALTQAVLNLVVNASDAIPANRKRHQGHIRIHAQRIDGPERVRLDVTDNGRGMSEEVKSRAFELFFTTKPRGMGTGLGLALVRKVVSQAGGTVEIQSKLGKGTTVSMLFPIAPKPKRSAVWATVSVADGRAAAMIQHVLLAQGLKAKLAQAPDGSGLWLTDPTAAALNKARAWLGAHPKGILILLGPPPRGSATKWAELSPLVINDRDDLGAIRGVITHAAHGLK